MSNDSATISLCKELISRASVTPEDAGCQKLMTERLAAIGFTIQHLRFDDVDNFGLFVGIQVLFCVLLDILM